MKCICGYEYKYGYNSKKEYCLLKGDDEFIQLRIMASVDIGFGGPRHIEYLYVCPKCYTVRFNW